MKITNISKKYSEQIMISVIIPVYNVEKYLGRCIGSVVKQTYNNFEIIAINDGSTDGSLEILNFYSKIDSRIKVINQENQGLARARNRGIQISKGQYLIFVDSDDTIKKTLLKDVLNFAIKKQLDIVTYGYNKIEEDGTVIPINNSCNAILDKVTARQGILSLKISPMACNKLIKRELFIEECIEYPADTLHEDILTTFKLVWSAQRVGQVSKCYYNWFIRGDSITGTLTKKHISDIFLHFDKIQSFLKDSDEFEIYKSEFFRGFFQMQNVLLKRILASEKGQELFSFLTSLQNRSDINSEVNLSILETYDHLLHNEYVSSIEIAELLFKKLNGFSWKIELKIFDQYVHYYLGGRYIGMLALNKGEISDHRGIIRANRRRINPDNMFKEFKDALHCMLNYILVERWFLEELDLQKVKNKIFENSKHMLKMKSISLKEVSHD